MVGQGAVEVEGAGARDPPAGTAVGADGGVEDMCIRAVFSVALSVVLPVVVMRCAPRSLV